MSYSAPIKSFWKTAVERRRLYLDYSCFLQEDENLTDFQVTISPYTVDEPLVVSSGYTDATNKKLAIFISGGLVNTSYVVKMVVRTDAGQVKQDNIGMAVIPG